jgi:hypothetical protein
MEAGDDTPEDRLAAMRDHAHTLSDFLVPTLSIECEPCGRAGRDTVARLKEKYGDAKLPELLHALASGRPSYPVQPSIIPSDKPPQRLRTSEPGTRRKPPARTGAGRGWCRAPFRAERGIRKRNRRLCRRRACDWHELAAIWRVRANATNCNVINQPFASRPSLPGVRQRRRGGGRKIGETAGVHSGKHPGHSQAWRLRLVHRSAKGT